MALRKTTVQKMRNVFGIDMDDISAAEEVTDAIDFATPIVSNEGDLGAIDWEGSTPGNITAKKYRWTKVGKQVTIWFKVTLDDSGATFSNLKWNLPADVPEPATWNDQPNGYPVTMSGAIHDNRIGNPNGPFIGSPILAEFAYIMKDNSGNWICQFNGGNAIGTDIFYSATYLTA